MSRSFDFTEGIKRIIAQRVNYICSNPKCRCFTAGPNVEDKTDTKIADCAHIYSGASDGPRYDLTIDDKFLKSHKNAIWLCKNCHREVDRNWREYPTDLLITWKEETERLVQNFIKSKTSPFKLFEDFKNHLFKHESDLPDVDFNILLAFFKEGFNPGTIVSKNDLSLKHYLIFSNFDNKLTIPNKFKYYDLLSQILLNLNDIEKVKMYLSKSIETGYDDPKRIFNEGFHSYLINKREDAQKICESLKNYPEHYFLLKLLIIDNKEELDEFIEEVSYSKYSHVNVFLNIAQKASNFSELATAREYIHKAIKLDNHTSNVCFMNAAILLDCVIKNPVFDENHLTLSEIDDLKLSLKLISETKERFIFADNDIQQVYWNLSIIHFLLGNYENSLITIKHINNRDFLTQSKFLKARIYCRQQNYELALNEIEKLLREEEYNLNFISLKGYICIDLQKYQEAIKCFELGLSKAPKNQEKRFIYGKAEVLFYTNGPLASEKYLISAYEKDKDVSYLIRNLISNYEKDEIKKIIAFYQKNIVEHINNISTYHQNMLGEFFFSINQFEISVEIFQKSYSQNLNLNFIEKYIRSLIAIDNRIEALKICREIRESKNCFNLIPLEASILDQLGKTDEAEKIAQDYNNNFNDNYSALIYSFYLIKNTKLESASEILIKLTTYLELSTYNFNIYINCLLEINESRKAFDHLYQYLQKHEESEEACNMFIILFLRISNIIEIREFLTSFEKKIQINCGVTLINEDNKIITVLIENKTNYLRDEYSIDSNWGKILNGKQKGDIVLKKDGSIENEYRIIDVCHKIVTKWNKLIADSAIKFSNPVITTIKINPEAKDIEGMLGKAADLIKTGANKEDEIHELYKSQKLTLGIIANIANKNLFNTIQYYIFNPAIEFIASSGNVHEIKHSTLVLKESNSITIDLTSIILISYLNIWDKFSNYFEEIYVAQSTITEIEKSYDDENSPFGESPGSLGRIGKQIGLIPRSKEQKEGWREYLISLKELVIQNCNVIQESEDLNLYKYKQKLRGLNLDIRESIGKCFIDSLAISLYKNSTFFSEDLILRKICDHFSITNFWVQPLLSILLEKNVINFEEYYDNITKLLSINYRFIHLNIPLLMQAIHKSKYEIDVTTNLYLDTLFKSDIPSLVNVGGGFLYGAIKSIPVLLNPTSLIMSFFSKYYEKTKSIGHLIAFIDSIYFATRDTHVAKLLTTKLVEWKSIYVFK